MAARRAAKNEMATRERLLEAAIALFGEHGYAATGTSAICERAGVAKTALYHHFGNKEGLLAEVIERIELSWIEEIQKGVYRVPDAEGRIETLLRSFRDIVQTSPHLWRLPAMAVLEQGDHSPRIRDAMTKVWARSEAALVQGIEDSIGLSLPDLDLVAHTVVSLLQFAMLKQITEPDPARLDREFAELALTLKLLVWVRLPYELQQQLHGMGPPVIPHHQSTED